MAKSDLLEELKNKIVADKVCDELAEQATQLVFGAGNPDADIVFIGEAPGKNEDIQGEPFVGAAGKFLNEMLALVGLEKKDIYITNIVKYRPPSNRDPLPEEKAAFLPYLSEQLEIIGPKLVVTLGRHSMEVLLPGLRIGQVHGQPKRVRVKNPGQVGRPGASAMQGGSEQRTEPHKEYGEGAAELPTQQRAASDSRVVGSADEQAVTTWVILPLFHPAAALYNGAMRQTLIDDFMRIPAILSKLSGETK
jgi:DNA polymerase